jgi:succinate dehydrogenase hydrophobic anchor subunit
MTDDELPAWLAALVTGLVILFCVLFTLAIMVPR